MVILRVAVYTGFTVLNGLTTVLLMKGSVSLYIDSSDISILCKYMIASFVLSDCNIQIALFLLHG